MLHESKSRLIESIKMESSVPYIAFVIYSVECSIVSLKLFINSLADLINLICFENLLHDICTTTGGRQWCQNKAYTNIDHPLFISVQN